MNSKKYLFSIVIFLFTFCSTTFSATYYVSTSGSDSGAGTLGDPWRTIYYAISQLNSGDTLFIQPGVYNIKRKIWITGKNNITIKGNGSNPEDVIIDGSFTDFKTVNNNDWTLYDASKGIYVSNNAYQYQPGVNDYLSSGELHGVFEYDNKKYCLVPYHNRELNGVLLHGWKDINSTNECYVDVPATSTGYSGEYVGPGIFWDYDNSRGQGAGKIFIRLTRTTDQDNNGLYPAIPTDPRQIKIWITATAVDIRLYGCQNLVFDNLTVKNNGIFYVMPYNSVMSSDIIIKNIIFTGGMRVGSVSLGNGCYNISLENLVFEGYFPPWIPWIDCKLGAQPARWLHGSAITVNDDCNNITVKDSIFYDCWSPIGMWVGDPHDISIFNNEIYRQKSDLGIGTTAYNIEINNNKFIDVPGGPARYGLDQCAYPGTKYIHHNIIKTAKTLRGRKDTTGEYVYGYLPDGSAWSSPLNIHLNIGFGDDGDPWNIYNNTIIWGSNEDGPTKGAGYTIYYGNFPAPYHITDIDTPQNVFNNIFLNNGPFYMGYKGYTDGRMECDGNLYYRVFTSEYCMFKNWDAPNWGDGEDYTDLADLQTETGWEINGIYGNPLLFSDFSPAQNSIASQGALDLSGMGLPGTGGSYRGALPPSANEKDDSDLYLKFNEEDGDIAFESANNLEGALINMDINNCWVDGRFSNAIFFDGVNDYVDVGDVNDIGTGDLSISVWVKTDGTSDYSGVVHKYLDAGSGTTGYSLYYGTSAEDVYTFYIAYNGTAVVAKSASGISDGNWHHIACVADRSGNAVVYTDGVAGTPQSMSSVSGYSINTSHSLEIGRRLNSNYCFDGAIDDLHIYNRVLTEQKINDLQCSLYLRFNEEDGDIASDSSINNLNGTLTNMDVSNCWIDGKFSNAIFFDGVNDYVDVGDVNDMGTGDLSISVWVKTDGTSDYSGVVHKYLDAGSGTTGYSLYYGTSAEDVYTFYIAYNGTAVVAKSASGISDGNWHHIACVADRSGNAVVYTDGVAGTPQSMSSVSGYSINTSYPLEIGRRLNSNYCFDGAIDDLRIYNRALTEQEINNL